MWIASIVSSCAGSFNRLPTPPTRHCMPHRNGTRLFALVRSEESKGVASRCVRPRTREARDKARCVVEASLPPDAPCVTRAAVLTITCWTHPTAVAFVVSDDRRTSNDREDESDFANSTFNSVIHNNMPATDVHVWHEWPDDPLTQTI